MNPLHTGGYAVPCESCGEPLLSDEEKRGTCGDCAKRSRRPCKCIKPQPRAGATGWVPCEGRCGGYLWVAP